MQTIKDQINETYDIVLIIGIENEKVITDLVVGPAGCKIHYPGYLNEILAKLNPCLELIRNNPLPLKYISDAYKLARDLMEEFLTPVTKRDFAKVHRSQN